MPLTKKLVNSGKFITAHRMLSQLSDIGSVQTLVVASDVPVVTNVVTSGITANNPGTSPITNGVWRSFKRVVMGVGDTGAVVDTNKDFCFEFPGNPKLIYGTAFPDYFVARPDLLTGGAGQAARWSPTIRFIHSGSVVALRYKTFAATTTYRLRVNGKYVTTAMQVLTGLSAGSFYDIVLTFSSSKVRDIEIEMVDNAFAAICSGPTDSISRPPISRMTIAGLGDSLTGGANSVLRQDTWLRHAADRFGCRPVNLGIGGTGFVNGLGTNAYIDRVTDVVRANPDVLVIFGGYNDAASYSSTVGTACTTLLKTLIPLLPNTPIFVVGCHRTSNVDSVNLRVANDNIRTSCLALNVPFVDIFSPAGNIVNYPTWVFGNSYGPGDIVVHGNIIYQCGWRSNGGITPGSSTNWVTLGWVDGTGKVGNATGFGNADVVIDTDGVHPTLLGHEILGGRISAGISSGLKTFL